MRTLAIDLGTRRVGLAMSDEGGRFATPYEVLSVAGSDAALEPIIRLIIQEGVERVVIGLPLNMDTTIGPAAQQTIGWARVLATRTGVPIVFVDERLTSFEAEQRLDDRKRTGERLTRGKRKKQLDALVAAAFLQEFLDGRLPGIDLSDTGLLD